jgi:hypothetical protein
MQPLIERLQTGLGYLKNVAGGTAGPIVFVTSDEAIPLESLESGIYLTDVHGRPRAAKPCFEALFEFVAVGGTAGQQRKDGILH